VGKSEVIRRLLLALSILFAAAVLGLSSANGNAPESDLPTVALSDTIGLSADTLALIDGRRLLEQERYEVARQRLRESARSDNIYIRIRALLSLNELEMRLENYDAARLYLEEYHIEAMQLFHRAMEMQDEMSEQMAIIDRCHRRLVNSITGTIAFILGGSVLLLMLQRRRRVISQASDRRVATDISDWNRYKADAKAFKQTEIYVEIDTLAGQPRGRGARVLSLTKQETLDRELAVGFAHFAVRLQSEYPSLTAADVKLCCLSLCGLSSWGCALCFGSTETNIVKQRKHKMKHKIEVNADGKTDPRGMALFDFIFGGTIDTAT
jgi:hypothetical protein